MAGFDVARSYVDLKVPKDRYRVEAAYAVGKRADKSKLPEALQAREKPSENLLEVSQWVTKLMSKVQITAPTCPACEASMDQLNVSTGSVWVCSQRPDCKGRRSARRYQKAVPPAATNAAERWS